MGKQTTSRIPELLAANQKELLEDWLREQRAALVTHYEQLVKSARDAVLLIDSSGRIVEANDAAAAAYGYSADDLRSMRLSDLRSEEVMSAAEQEWQATAQPSGILFETTHQRKDGSTFPVEISAHSIDIEGTLYRQSFVRDITERKRTEEQLKKSENRFRKLFDNASAGIIICDLIRDQDGKIVDYIHVHANKAIFKHAGITEKDVVGKRCSEVIPPDETAPFIELLTEVLETGEPYSYQQHFPSLGRTIENRPFMIENDTFALTFFDITERVQAERTLKWTAERLQSLSRRLLETQEAERKAIAMELHDEVGQALSAIKLNLSYAMRTVRDEAALKKLQDTVKIADTVLGQARDLSLNLRPPQLDLMGLEAALRAFLEKSTAAAGMALQFAAGSNPETRNPQVEIACFRVAQEAMTNIIRHAGAKTVSVELTQGEGWIRLRVRDDGRGFDLRAADESMARGLSMGLLGMHERTLLAGGEFDIVAAPGEGTEIRASFPIAQASDANVPEPGAVQ